MAFSTIRTTYGLTKLAAAAATSTLINLTQIAVGDGNGNAVTPTLGQTNLVRERYRAAPNRVYQYPGDPTMYVAELVVPIASAGFTLREIGAFDASGGLIAVGNLPDAYLPLASEGSFTDAVIRMVFKAGAAGVITLQVDPTVAVASQQWVLSNVTPCSLFPGGTTGQILRKKSNGCGDTEWADPTSVNVTVSSLEETQTLAAAQTVVDWAIVNNTGVAVYIEGVRLRASQFTKHATINTRITLAQSYPAGTKIVGVQNEPAGTLVDPLAKAQNLADVPDKAAARTNLDIYSKAEANAAGQPGAVVHFARSTAPTGWLKANGAAVSRTAYASLFAAIGTTFGSGDGVNTFNLPDLRGEFLRGWDDGRGVDGGRVFGSAQNHQIQDHTHLIIMPRNLPDTDRGIGNSSIWSIDDQVYSYTTGVQAGANFGAETRPRSIALLTCIKF
jgi:phage-related tail fiber protein